jgi:hypothetical protein
MASCDPGPIWSNSCNEDGFDDLVVQIEDNDGVFNPGDTTDTVTGSLAIPDNCEKFHEARKENEAATKHPFVCH